MLMPPYRSATALNGLLNEHSVAAHQQSFPIAWIDLGRRDGRDSRGSRPLLLASIGK